MALRYYLMAAAIMMGPRIGMTFDEEDMTNNLAQDYATCAAFYIVMSQGHPDLKDNEGLESARDTALGMSIRLSNKEVTQLRIELGIKAMGKRIDYDYKNASIIMNDYLYFCNDLINNPEERIEYWRSKIEQ